MPHRAQPEVGRGIMRLAAQHFAVLPFRFPQPAELAVGEREIGPRQHMVRHQRHCLPEADRRLRDLAARREQVAQMVVGHGIPGPQRDGPVQMGFPFLRAAGRSQSDAEAAVILMDAGPRGNRPFDELDRRPVIARLMGDHPKQMERVGLTRLGLEDPAIDPLGAHSLARLMVVDAGLEQFGDVQRRALSHDIDTPQRSRSGMARVGLY